MGDNIFKRMFGKSDIEERKTTILPTTSLGIPYGSYESTPISVQASLQLSAIYRAVDVISDAVASQKWDILEYDDVKGFTPNPFHANSEMLNLSPNVGMSRFSFMKTIVTKMLLEGNAFVKITRSLRGLPESLELIIDPVTMYVNKDGTTYYEITRSGEAETPEKVDGDDMIHILNFTYNGYIGVSTLVHAAGATSLSNSAEKTASGFYNSGMNAGGILSVEGKLTPEKAEGIKASWALAFNTDTGSPGGIAVMEKGLEFQQLTINPQDSQLLETRQFNISEIARFFGVSPSKLFDSANQTYSNVEAFQLGFLTDTISPLDSKIENEFNRKLFPPSVRKKTKLNLSIKELLMANMDTRANFLSKMFQSGGYTVNEIRAELGLPFDEDKNSNMPLVQVNMSPIDKLGVKAPVPVKTKVEKPPVDKKVEDKKEEDGE